MAGPCCGSCVLPLSDEVLNNRVASSTAPAHSSTPMPADSTDGAVEIKAGLCNADPITKQGKRIQMAQMLCIPLIPIVILIIQACLSLADSVASKVRNSLSSNTTVYRPFDWRCDFNDKLGLID